MMRAPPNGSGTKNQKIAITMQMTQDDWPQYLGTAIITGNNHISFCLHIVLFPRTTLKLFIPQRNLVCLNMPSMGILEIQVEDV